MVRSKSPKTYFSQTVEFGHETPAIVFKMPFPTFLSISIDIFGATEIRDLGLALGLSYASSLDFTKTPKATQTSPFSSFPPSPSFLSKNGGGE